MLYVTIIVLLLTAATGAADTDAQAQHRSRAPGQSSSGTERQAVMEQTIYVPAYSHIYYYNKKHQVQLAVTLSIRNTDLQHPITVTSVRYYNTPGQLLKEYLADPLQLAPLASADFVVEERDTRGGSGANFIVEWRAEARVNEPIIEAVMISSGTQGISFVSPGRVISKPGQ
jgi:hypothetical protein